jgi:kynurenine formamidase
VYTVIDLTQALSDASLSYPGTVPAWTAERLKIDNPKATVTRFSAFDSHAGTHLDAPLHFAPGGSDVAELPLRLYPAIVVPVGDASIVASCMGSRPRPEKACGEDVQ